MAAVAEVSASPVQANGFLNRLRRPRRNIWDRSRPDVQQWILQFMSMGYDEAVGQRSGIREAFILTVPE